MKHTLILCRRRSNWLLTVAVLLTLQLLGCGEDKKPASKKAPAVITAQDSGFRPAVNGLKFENFAGYVKSAIYDTPAMVRAFGSGVCVDPAAADCVLRPEAKKWSQQINASTKGGLCEGFAVLSGLAWQGKVDLSVYGATTLADIDRSKNKAVDSEIAYWFGSQALTSVTKNTLREDAVRATALLSESFAKSKNGETWRIGILRLDAKGQPSGGHALTPYAVEADGAGKWRIRVYDSNHPLEERYIAVDEKANTWQYVAATNPNEPEGIYEGGPGNRNRMYLVPNSVRLGQQPCAFCGKGGKADESGAGFASVLPVGPLDVTITDAQGRQVKRGDGDFTLDIPGATADPLFGLFWRDKTPTLYKIPTGQMEVSAKADEGVGTDSDQISLAIYEADGGFASVEGQGLGGTHTLKVAEDGSASYKTDTDNAGPFSVSLVTEDGTVVTISIEITGTTAGADISLSVDPKTGETKVSVSSGGTVNLTVTKQTEDETTTFDGSIVTQPGGSATLDVADMKNGEPLEATVDKGDGSGPQTTTVLPCSEDPNCKPITTTDTDIVPDAEDNCPADNNPDQADLDKDGIGDVCDSDVDGDGVDSLSDCNDLDASVTAGCGGKGDKCETAADCPATEANSCREARCNPDGSCGSQPVANGSACNDGDACTTGEACNGGSCQGATALTCNDNNPCTTDSCAAASGCVYTNNTATCDDGDACTSADLCAGGACTGNAVACDDGNLCTDDSCNKTTGCVALPNTASCTDGDSCTSGDACSAGSCKSGTPLVCTDNNACTDDTCNPQTGCTSTPNSASCNDNDACTSGEACNAGNCTGGTAVACDDNNICTDDSCSAQSGCVNLPNTASCTDNDPCTATDVCSAGSCTGSGTVTCEDANPCTTDACDSVTGCSNLPNQATCTDGDACSEGDVCAGGSCNAGTAVDCNDNNPCTDDTCNAATGCSNLPNQATCTDGDACSEGDICAGGSCSAGSAVNCDDGNPCTDGTCFPDTGCVASANSGPCSDGDPCTADDSCVGGSCSAGSAVNCDDGNPCTEDSCSPDIGCVASANAGPCSDGDACTADDSCVAGSCVAGATVVDCNDNNPCTDDSCSPGIGCVASDNAAPCSDDDACTADDACVAGSCAGQPTDCDDGNACTNDNCNPVSGCFSSDTTGPCDDGNVCTTPGICEFGTCTGQAQVTCDDGNACTADSCQPFAGCQSIPVQAGTACSDGDPCTSDDICNGSLICNGTALDCDDANGCTMDLCIDGLCSTVTEDGTPCSDGDPCTSQDACFGLACVGGAPTSCDTGDPCLEGSCQPGIGCTAQFGNAPCDDNNVCTFSDFCESGACLGTLDDCDDGDSCSIDSCNQVAGCLHAPASDFTPCNDNQPCTVDEACSAGQCLGTPNPECQVPVSNGVVAHYSAKVTASLDLEGNNVFAWQDLSGLGHDLVNTGGFPVYQETSFNGLPAVDFAGDVGMVTPPFQNSLDMTVFLVVQHRPMDGYGCYAHHGDRDFDWSLEQSAFNSNFVQLQSQNDGNCGQTLAVGEYYVLVSRINGADRLFTAVSSSTVTATASGVSITPAAVQMYVGRSNAGEGSNTLLGEFIYYNRALSDLEVEDMVVYLQSQWNFPL